MRFVIDGWWRAFQLHLIDCSALCQSHGNHWQTAYRWIRRFRAEGAAGLPDRSSRPWSLPARTSSEREQAVLDAQRSVRSGPMWIAALTGVPARTESRVLHRPGKPRLADCHPVTGAPIRGQKNGQRV